MFLLRFKICIFLSLFHLVYNADVTAQDFGAPPIQSHYPAAQDNDGPYTMSSPGIIGVGLKLVEKLTGGILPVGQLLGINKRKKDKEESDDPETVVVIRGSNGRYYTPSRQSDKGFDDYGDDSSAGPDDKSTKPADKPKDKDKTSEKASVKPEVPVRTEKEDTAKNTTKNEITSEKATGKSEWASNDNLNLPFIDKVVTKTIEEVKEHAKKKKLSTMSADDMFPFQPVHPGPDMY